MPAPQLCRQSRWTLGKLFPGTWEEERSRSKRRMVQRGRSSGSFYCEIGLYVQEGPFFSIIRVVDNNNKTPQNKRTV